MSDQTAVLCSCAECTNGHKWRIQLAVVKCSGCGSDVVARRLANCPICNEPAEKMEIRLDHLAGGMAVMPLCKGASRVSQVDVMVLTREEFPFERELKEANAQIPQNSSGDVDRTPAEGV